MHEPRRSWHKWWYWPTILCTFFGFAATIVQARYEAWGVRENRSWNKYRSGGGAIISRWDGWEWTDNYDASGRIVAVGSVAYLVRRQSDPDQLKATLICPARPPPSWSRPAGGPPSLSTQLDRVGLLEIVFGWPFRSMSCRLANFAELDSQGSLAEGSTLLFYFVDGIRIPNPPPSSPGGGIGYHPDLLQWPWITANDSVPEVMLDNPASLTPAHLAEEIFTARPPGDIDFALPTRVLWLGFLMNTLVYAALLFALCLATRGGFVSLRCALRVARVRRGQCRVCGYSLEGLSRCPECGAVVK